MSRSSQNTGSHNVLRPGDFEAIVRHYCFEYRTLVREELQYYKDQPSLRHAVRVAALSQHPDGKRMSHQRRIPSSSLREAEVRLQRIASDLRDAGTFDELHDLINSAIRSIHKIGELAVYDVALRVGAFLRVEPTRIYLHTGTRDGARALGLDTRGGVIEVSAVPKPMRRLLAREIEDVLCIYKELMRPERGNRVGRPVRC